MTTLICTVGGSHQPIVKAINSLTPDKTIFICSEDNEETNKKGSYISVNGKGLMNKSSFNLENPDLPNIVTQCQLTEKTYQIEKVPSDDLNTCYIKMQDIIKDLDQQHIICDYTGGTKTMSAALAMLAADNYLTLNLIIGTRADHIKVQDGSEESVEMDIHALRSSREIKASAALWGNYAYDQAQQTVESLPANMQNRAGRKRFIELSKAFAAWDKFDHEQALNILENYQNIIGRYYSKHLTTLRHLIDTNKSTEDKIKYTPYLIIDIWNSAKRKAHQGYYDDAIARAYRLLECTAQWILLKEKGWETSNLPEDLPSHIQITKNRQQQNQAGLYASWQLIQEFGNNTASKFAKQELDKMMTYIQIRNNSILAHGYTPVHKEQWNEFEQWLKQCFFNMLDQQIQPLIGKTIKATELQLPQSYPSELL